MKLGPLAEIIRQQFKKYTKKFGLNGKPWEAGCIKFMRPLQPLTLFLRDDLK
jgi:hypothetical protein